MAQAQCLGHFSCPETAGETPALLPIDARRLAAATIRWKVYHVHTGKSKESVGQLALTGVIESDPQRPYFRALRSEPGTGPVRLAR